MSLDHFIVRKAAPSIVKREVRLEKRYDRKEQRIDVLLKQWRRKRQARPVDPKKPVFQTKKKNKHYDTEKREEILQYYEEIGYKDAIAGKQCKILFVSLYNLTSVRRYKDAIDFFEHDVEHFHFTVLQKLENASFEQRVEMLMLEIETLDPTTVVFVGQTLASLWYNDFVEPTAQLDLNAIYNANQQLHTSKLAGRKRWIYLMKDFPFNLNQRAETFFLSMHGNALLNDMDQIYLHHAQYPKEKSIEGAVSERRTVHVDRPTVAAEDNVNLKVIHINFDKEQNLFYIYGRDARGYSHTIELHDVDFEFYMEQKDPKFFENAEDSLFRVKEEMGVGDEFYFSYAPCKRRLLHSSNRTPVPMIHVVYSHFKEAASLAKAIKDDFEDNSLVFHQFAEDPVRQLGTRFGIYVGSSCRFEQLEMHPDPSLFTTDTAYRTSVIRAEPDIDDVPITLKELCFDSEQFSTGGFPHPALNPTCMITVALRTYDLEEKYEVQRNAAKPSTVFRTGRVNNVRLLTFCVQDARPTPPPVFDPSVLPEPPEPPNVADLDPRYVESVCKDYRARYKQWVEYVGSYREEVLFTGELLDNLRDETSDVNAIYKAWRDNYIFGRVTEIQAPSDACGSIEADWDLYHKIDEVYCYPTEREAICAFFDLINAYDADIITGYNTENHDFTQIFHRATQLKIPTYIGRRRNVESTTKRQKKSSNQQGDQLVTILNIEGRSSIDYLTAVRTERKMPHYNLGYVSSEFFDDTKNDVPHTSIPKLFFNDRTKLKDYGVKDAELPYRVGNHMGKMPFVVSLIGSTGILPQDIYTRGQTKRLENIFYKTLREENIDLVVDGKNPFASIGTGINVDYIKDLYDKFPNDPQIKKIYENTNKKSSKYQGATCVETEEGFYEGVYISLDFVSLYPSIMLAANAGPDTAVFASEVSQYPDNEFFYTGRYYYNKATNQEEELCFVKPRILNAPPEGQEHLYVYYEAKKGYALKSEMSVFSLVIQKLLSKRRAAKKQMNQHEPGSKLYELYNTEQLTWKILTNSVYGFIGSTTSRLARQDIADFVTAWGRKLLQMKREFLEKEYNAEIIGGDTDSLFFRIPGIVRIDQLFEEDEQGVSFVKRLEDNVNAVFAPYAPVEDEFDGVYKDTLFFGKKHAIGVRIEEAWDPVTRKRYIPEETMNHIKGKGVEYVRRSSNSFIKQTQKNAVLVLYGYEKDSSGRTVRLHPNIRDNVPRMAEFVREQVHRIVTRDIPMHDVINTVQVSKASYKSETNVVEQLRKQARENNFAEPTLGDRAAFIVVEYGNRKLERTSETSCAFKDLLKGEKVSEPKFAFENGLRWDRRILLEALKNAMTPIFRCFPGHKKYIKDLFETPLRELRSDKTTKYLGDPSMLPTSTSYHCFICGKVSGRRICYECTDDQDQKERQMQLLQERSEVCWACVGDKSRSTPVDCDNQTCKSFWPRYKLELIDKYLEEAF